MPPQVDVCFDYISVDPSLFSRYQYFDQVTVTAYSCPIPQPTWNIRQSAVCSHSSIWADAEINKVLWRDGLLPLFWCRCFLTSAVNLQMRWMMAWMFFLNFCFSPSKKIKNSQRDILESWDRGGGFSGLLIWFVLLIYSELKPYMLRFILEQNFFFNGWVINSHRRSYNRNTDRHLTITVVPGLL